MGDPIRMLWRKGGTSPTGDSDRGPTRTRTSSTIGGIRGTVRAAGSLLLAAILFPIGAPPSFAHEDPVREVILGILEAHERALVDISFRYTFTVLETVDDGPLNARAKPYHTERPHYVLNGKQGLILNDSDDSTKSESSLHGKSRAIIFDRGSRDSKIFWKSAGGGKKWSGFEERGGSGLLQTSAENAIGCPLGIPLSRLVTMGKQIEPSACRLCQGMFQGPHFETRIEDVLPESSGVSFILEFGLDGIPGPRRLVLFSRTSVDKARVPLASETTPRSGTIYEWLDLSPHDEAVWWPRRFRARRIGKQYVNDYLFDPGKVAIPHEPQYDAFLSLEAFKGAEITDLESSLISIIGGTHNHSATQVEIGTLIDEMRTVVEETTAQQSGSKQTKAFSLAVMGFIGILAALGCRYLTRGRTPNGKAGGRVLTTTIVSLFLISSSTGAQEAPVGSIQDAGTTNCALTATCAALKWAMGDRAPSLADISKVLPVSASGESSLADIEAVVTQYWPDAAAISLGGELVPAAGSVAILHLPLSRSEHQGHFVVVAFCGGDSVVVLDPPFRPRRVRLPILKALTDGNMVFLATPKQSELETGLSQGFVVLLGFIVGTLIPLPRLRSGAGQITGRTGQGCAEE